MSDEVIFEVSVLNDAIQKAARVAPIKGAGADKAAGILLDIDPAKQSVEVKATDLNITYIQRIECTEAKGNPTRWRIPSVVFAGMVSVLPQNSTVRLIDRHTDGKIRLQCGKTNAALNMLPAGEFPNFTTFDKVLTEANQFASKAGRISWACDTKSKGALSGVHLENDLLVATNNMVLASIPCHVKLDAPLTVPLGQLEPLLKTGSDVQIAPEADKFYVKLDADAYCTSTIFNAPYPKIANGMRKNFAGTMEFHRQSFIDSLIRLQSMIRTEREIPGLTIELETSGFVKQLVMDVEVAEMGRMRDGVDVISDYDAEETPFKYYLVPQMLIDALEHTEGNRVFLDFGWVEDRSKDNKATIRLRDESGYMCYISPRVRS